MKFAVFVLTIVLISESLASDAHAKWNHHKQVHNKTYHNSEHEEKCRQKFMKMDKMIEEHNKQAAAGNATYFVDHNMFSDDISHNPMKFKGLLSLNDLNKRQSKIRITPYTAKSTASALPPNFDWRSRGWNVPVRNQGQCGCCWSFTVTASLEAQIFIKTGKIVTLSPEELIDCSSNYGTHGCHGAKVTDGFAYIADNGVTEERNLPYQYAQSEDNYNSCPYNKIKSMNRYKISGVTWIPQKNTQLLKDALVNVGPIAIAIDSDTNAFKHYKGGFWDGSEMNSYKKCSSQVDHAVLLIGYGANHPQSGKPYWIIKNQWGSNWGNNGIMYLADDGTDNCGITIQAFIPNLA